MGSESTRPPGHARPETTPLSLLDHVLSSLPKWLEPLPRPGEPLAWVSPLEGEPDLWGGQGATDAGRGRQCGLSLAGLQG